MRPNIRGRVPSGPSEESELPAVAIWVIWTVGDCRELGTWHGWDRGNCWETVGNCGHWDWELRTWQPHHGQVKSLSLKMPGRTLLHVNFSKGESVG